MERLRERGIQFFKYNAPKDKLDIINEIDRYIARPGQALAYKIGELKINELRAKAKQKQGDKFDMRGFHDIVLQNGAVPLDMPERVVGDDAVNPSLACGPVLCVSIRGGARKARCSDSRLRRGSGLSRILLLRLAFGHIHDNDIALNCDTGGR